MGFWHVKLAAEDRMLYFLTEIEGDFVKLDIRSKKAKYLLPTNYSELPEMYAGSVLASSERHLYGVAQGGKYFFDYDLEKNYCSYELIEMEKYSLHSPAFVKHVKKAIYVLPNVGDIIVKIDIEEKVVSSISLSNMINISDKNAVLKHAYLVDVVNDDEFWLISKMDKCIYKYNVITNAFIKEEYPIQIGVVRIGRRYDTKGVYLLNENNELYYWDGNSLKTICSMSNCNPFGVFSISDKWIWFFPTIGEDIFKYNLLMKKGYKFINYPSYFKYNNDFSNVWWKYGLPIKERSVEYFPMHCGNDIFAINENGTGDYINVIFPSNVDCIDNNIRKKHIEKEDGCITIADFVDYLL